MQNRKLYYESNAQKYLQKEVINYMKTKPKKEMMYIAVIAVLVILVLILLSFMLPKNKKGQIYEPGVYTKELQIGDSTIEIEVSLDGRGVTSVDVADEDKESVTYALIKPSIERISKELSAGTSVEEFTFSEGSTFTEKLLLDAIEEILQKRRITDNNNP